MRTTTIVRIGGDVDWIARYLVGLPFRCEILEPDTVRAEIRRVARQLLREHPPAGHDAVGSGAKRSTPLPSGSRTEA